MSIMKTFKGKLTSDNNVTNQDRIYLSGGDAKTCYRIHDLKLIATSESADISPVVKIYQDQQSAVNETIDFEEEGLIAAAIYRQDSGNNYPPQQTIVFDNVVFNQDIFITYKDNETSAASVNYLIILEEIKANDAELAVINYQAALLHG